VDAFRNEAVPAAEAFQPDLVLISAGFDGHADDPLGQFHLREEHFAELTHAAMDIAERFARGRMVSILEGGYELLALGASVRVHVETLMNGGGR
jgi:acetoin utilization deacetylase AcuC-like enzyme